MQPAPMFPEYFPLLRLFSLLFQTFDVLPDGLAKEAGPVAGRFRPLGDHPVDTLENMLINGDRNSFHISLDNNTMRERPGCFDDGR